MRSKPIRKNPNKERIFSQKQNIEDFDYIKGHRGKVDGENQIAREGFKKGGSKWELSLKKQPKIKII